MRKAIKILGVGLIVLVLLGLSIRIVFKYLYYPNKPTSYSIHREKEAGEVNPGEYLMDPPLGGCFDSCYGKTEEVSCEAYAYNWDVCKINCYGYLYNNCSSTNFELLFGILTQ